MSHLWARLSWSKPHLQARLWPSDKFSLQSVLFLHLYLSKCHKLIYVCCLFYSSSTFLSPSSNIVIIHNRPTADFLKPRWTKNLILVSAPPCTSQVTFSTSFNQAVSCLIELVLQIKSDDAHERTMSAVKLYVSAIDQKWVSKTVLQSIFFSPRQFW